jgi:hypothetical protein
MPIRTLQLVFDLRQQFLKGDPPEDIKKLLQQRMRRDDLFARVALDIDHLLGEIEKVDAGRLDEFQSVVPRSVSPPDSGVVSASGPLLKSLEVDESISQPEPSPSDQPALTCQGTINEAAPPTEFLDEAPSTSPPEATQKLDVATAQPTVDVSIAPVGRVELLGPAGKEGAKAEPKRKPLAQQPKPISAGAVLAVTVMLSTLALTSNFIHIKSSF